MRRKTKNVRCFISILCSLFKKLTNKPDCNTDSFRSNNYKNPKLIITGIAFFKNWYF